MTVEKRVVNVFFGGDLYFSPRVYSSYVFPPSPPSIHGIIDHVPIVMLVNGVADERRGALPRLKNRQENNEKKDKNSGLGGGGRVEGQDNIPNPTVSASLGRTRDRIHSEFFCMSRRRLRFERRKKNTLTALVYDRSSGHRVRGYSYI
jgi:hypothetical protein